MSNPLHNKARDYARKVYADPSDDEIEIDEDAEVHDSDDGGFWVQTWTYVRREEIEEELS